MGNYSKLSNFNPRANFNQVRFGEDTPITEMELNEAQQITQNQIKELTQYMWGDYKFFRGGRLNLNLDNNMLTLKDQPINVLGHNIFISSLSMLLPYYNTAYLKVTEEVIDTKSEIKTYGNKQGTSTEINMLLDPRLQGIETARRQQIQYDLVKGITNDRFNAQVTPVKFGKGVNSKGLNVDYNNNLEIQAELFEIYGETIQDPRNLADIKSLGELVVNEQGEPILDSEGNKQYRINITSYGKNLINALEPIKGYLDGTTRTFIVTDITRCIIAKVKPNTQYTISTPCEINVEYNRNMLALFSEYPKSGVAWTTPTVGGDLIQGKRTFTTKSDTHYVVFYYTNDINNIGTNFKAQLEEGTQVTPYEPYQEINTEIILPCQLEQIKDVADKFYNMNQNWQIDKQVETITRNGSERYYIVSTKTNVIGFGFDLTDKSQGSHLGRVMCDKFAFRDNDELEGLRIGNSGNSIFIYIEKTKLATQDVEGFKKWLQSNNLTIKYQLATPKNIALPQGVQKQLNDVALEENPIMKYTSDTGYLTCNETKEGTVNNIEIQGRTLVNLYNPSSNSDFSIGRNNYDANTGVLTLKGIGNWSNGFLNYNGLLKPSTKYLILVEVLENALEGGNEIQISTQMNGECAFDSTYSIRTGARGTYTFEATTLSDLSNVTYLLRTHLKPTTTGGYVKLRILIVESSKAKGISSYFKGMQSVGDGVDKLEILSRNENLFNIGGLPLEQKHSSANLTRQGDVVTIQGLLSSDKESVTNPQLLNKEAGVYLEEGKEYYFSFESDSPRGNVPGVDTTEMYWCLDKVYNTYISVSNPRYWTCTKTGYYYPRFDVNKGNATHKFWDIQVKPKESSKIYVPYKEDKKALLYQDREGNWYKPILRSVNDKVKDMYDSVNLKYHKKCAVVTFNGSENWVLNKTIGNKLQFLVAILGAKSGEVTCDRFVYMNNVESKECIWIYNNEKFVIHIDTSKLETQDVDGFKKWLQANPVTVVYELAYEEVYDVNVKDISTFDNVTLMQVLGGAVVPSYFGVTDFRETKGIPFPHVERGYVTVKGNSVQASKMSYKCYLKEPQIGEVDDNAIAYIPIAFRQGDTLKDLRLFEEVVNYYSKDKNMSTGKYEKVVSKRTNGTIDTVSYLKDVDSRGNYGTMEVNYYDSLGLYVTYTERYRLTYDMDDELIGKELI